MILVINIHQSYQVDSVNVPQPQGHLFLPSIIFADEPTGALDSKSTLDLLKRLKYMNEEFNTTILMVTHDPVAASFQTVL